MIARTLERKLTEAATLYPVLTLTGPRQSGKTTLVKQAFPDHDYVSLELPEQRDLALSDPRGFFSQYDGPVILDEVQRAPDLFSYIQVIVDEKDRPGHFVLTGSQNFLLLSNITQSLAGRCAVHHLLPFSLSELAGRDPIDLDTLGKGPVTRLEAPARDMMDTLFTGFYPRIHDKSIPAQDWLGNYFQTYLERDVRNMLKIGDLEAFGRFVRMCAGRAGQILNLSSLASDCGITHTTANRWLSVLEASFVVARLRPYYRNFGKRLIKSSKIYFLDTGLLCYLLKIHKPKELHIHASRGAIFENFVFAELYKNFLHLGEQPGLYFWRDSTGHEIDFLLERGQHLVPIEVKSAQTIAADFFNEIRRFKTLTHNEKAPAALIYGGDHSIQHSGIAVYPWFAL